MEREIRELLKSIDKLNVTAERLKMTLPLFLEVFIPKAALKSINKYLDLEKDKYYPTIERLLTHTSGYKEFYPSVKTTINQINGENAV